MEKNIKLLLILIPALMSNTALFCSRPIELPITTYTTQNIPSVTCYVASFTQDDIPGKQYSTQPLNIGFQSVAVGTASINVRLSDKINISEALTTHVQ
jgi:hypothetical protein